MATISRRQNGEKARRARRQDGERARRQDGERGLGQEMTDQEADGCRTLAEESERIVAADPEITPGDFLRALGRLVAGIGPGIAGILDLASGGYNEISGRGFRAEFDDGSAGQARHFAGTAVSVALLGTKATELIAHTIVDPADTSDGRLSASAIEFATLVLDEELAVEDASAWIVNELCAAAGLKDQ